MDNVNKRPDVGDAEDLEGNNEEEGGAQGSDTREESADREPASEASPNNQQPTSLEIKMSLSLRRKLEQTASREGVPVSDLACELLAEGIVLRAWEIIERKNTMRTGQGNFQGGNNRQGNFNRNFRSNEKGGNRQRNYQNIMEDKAAFLEYVRNQERKRR